MFFRGMKNTKHYFFIEKEHFKPKVLYFCALTVIKIYSLWQTLHQK